MNVVVHNGAMLVHSQVCSALALQGVQPLGTAVLGDTGVCEQQEPAVSSRSPLCNAARCWRCRWHHVGSLQRPWDSPGVPCASPVGTVQREGLRECRTAPRSAVRA